MKSDPPLVDSSERPPRWAFLACGVLVGVAVLQIVIAFTTELTPWKGGGFGMFATSDTGGNRQVRAYEVFDDGERRLSLPRRDPLRRVMLNHPTEQRIGAYANALAARLERRRSGLQAVRVELWRASFDPATGSYRSEPWHEYLLELQRPVAPAGARK
ncbi:MAG TPA: hypothetical protein VNB06_23110 [Thermoanaerobaculia bacterium]|nr:hypothetical protein [Thermoanaerobaculia bacterium]